MPRRRPPIAVEIGDPHRPRVVLAAQEMRGPEPVGEPSTAIVYGATLAELLDFLREKIDPEKALDAAVAQLRTPHGAALNGRPRRSIVGTNRWANLTPAERARRSSIMAKSARKRWANTPPAARAAQLRKMVERRYGKRPRQQKAPPG